MSILYGTGGGGGFMGVVAGSPSANAGAGLVVVSSTASAVQEIIDRPPVRIKAIKSIFFIFLIIKNWT